MPVLQRKSLQAVALACAIAASVAGGAALNWVPVPAAQAQQAVSPPVAAPLVSGLPDFSALVEHVGPSVVNIRTTEKISNRRGGGGAALGMDEDMLEFFRRFGVPVPNVPNQPQRPGPGAEESVPSGVGSGFILTADGYVMTNAHVVEGADEVIVTLTDKREFKAKIVGSDKRTDVAVVKIEAKDLPAVKIGDVNKSKKKPGSISGDR